MDRHLHLQHAHRAGGRAGTCARAGVGRCAKEITAGKAVVVGKQPFIMGMGDPNRGEPLFVELVRRPYGQHSSSRAVIVIDTTGTYTYTQLRPFQAGLLMTRDRLYMKVDDEMNDWPPTEVERELGEWRVIDGWTIASLLLAFAAYG